MTDEQLRDEAAARLAKRILACPANDWVAIKSACHEFALEWTGFADAAATLVAAETCGLHNNGVEA